MKIISVIVLLTISGYSEARCKCEYMLKHYEELGCKPVYANEEDCCPTHYDCDEIMKTHVSSEGPTPPSACYFRGKHYQEDQPIDNNITMSFCRAGCHCNGGSIICAIVDCKEFFGDKLEKNCFRQYKHYQCCSSGTACPPFDNLAVCKNGDKVYHEGQRFYPEENPCLSCICQKGFEGKFEQPYCVPINCNFEPKLKELRDHCTPIYYGTKRCCATHWTCPKDKENQTIGKPVDENTDKTKVCIYGKRMLNIGDKFDLLKDVNCACNVPPLITCIKKPQE